MKRRRFRRAWLAAALCTGSLINSSSPLRADEEEAPAPSQFSQDAARDAERIGWLRPNVTRPELDAPFALVDGSGTPRCFVRPTPGTDLRTFLHQKVRVRGTTLEPAGTPGFTLEAQEVASPDGRLLQAPPQRRLAPGRGLDLGVRPVAYNQQVPTPAVEEIPGPTGLGAPNDGGAQFPTDDSFYGPDQNWNGPDGALPHFDGPNCGHPGGCGSPMCSRCCQPFCGPPGHIWVRGEWLYWSTQGMRVPPLVSTGPSTTQPGYLGSPGTAVLFGGNQVDNYARSGGRVTLGTWFNCAQTVGIEGDFFDLMPATANYFASSTGNPILSRPFFDVRPTLGAENVELVAAPGIVSGSVAAETYTRLLGAGLRLRFNLCCGSGCFSNQCLPGMNGPGGFRYDFLLGYRYLRLADGVSVNENLTSGPQAPATQQGTFVINDSFRTLNQFNGIDFGTAMQWYRGRWGLEFNQRLALGNTNQMVSIVGTTVSTPTGGTSTTSQGGLLAQTSNIGNYNRNAFAIVPELDFNLTYQLTPRLRAVAGYTFIYWSNVARAGSQIDTDVNSTLLPNSPNPPAGDLRHPQFSYHETPFWAQGLNLGLDYRW